MLAERHYMREPAGRAPLSVTVILMIALVAVFALQCMDRAFNRGQVEAWLALTSSGLRSGFVWQLITFQFLHAGLLHLLVNLLGLWFLGRMAEQMLGKSRFLLAYLGAGIVGGLFQGLLMLAFPGHFGGRLFGASAGISGVFAIIAMLAGDSVMRVNFIVPVRARTLLWIFLGIGIFFTLVPVPGDSTAHAAHLGGMLAGMAFVRLGWQHDYQPLPWAGFWSWLRGLVSGPSRPARRRPGSRQYPAWFDDLADKPARRPAATSTETDDTFISSQVDPILDKISAHGIHSLTAEERGILERARSRMAKR